MPFSIVRNDITLMKVDAIVNASNSALLKGGGVCGAIFEAAGTDELQSECAALGGCEVGEAVITSGCNLPAKYIIHTAGPIWQGGNHNESKLLYSCYKNSLELALKNNLESVAFPLISSGIFGYPKDEALQVAIDAIGAFLLKHEMTVYLVVFDKKSFVLSERLFTSIERFIDDNYVDLNTEERRLEASCNYIQNNMDYDAYIHKSNRSLIDVVSQIGETFSEMLLRLIDEKGTTDVMTYKKANIDRKLFSKIRSNKNYCPSKPTAIAFAIALELSLDETEDLLNKAGYSLSHSNRFDMIIEYFIEEGNYNIFEINEALFAFDQSMLG